MTRPVVIGTAVLYQADCREILPGLLADHIITDPPYSDGLHANHNASAARRADGAMARELGYAALNPGEAEALAEDFNAAAAGWILWMTDSELAPVIRAALARLGRTTFAPLPYFHAGRSVRLAGDGPSSWTDWIVVARTPALHRWGTLRGGYIARSGWDDKEIIGGKPTRLMQLMVCDYSRPGDVVCDPFMGAGTTGVACWRAGRGFIGIEIDPRTFDLACRRIEAAQRQGDLFADAGVPTVSFEQDELLLTRIAP
jgi:hypothetical protein